MTRKGYEFSERTKDEAIRRWRINNPHQSHIPNSELEVDHKVPVWFAKREGISKEVVKSLQNARVLTKTEHKGRNHWDEEEIRFFLAQLVNFIGSLF